MVVDANVDRCEGLLATIGEVNLHHTGIKTEAHVNQIVITSALMVADASTADDVVRARGPLPLDQPAEFKLLVRHPVGLPQPARVSWSPDEAPVGRILGGCYPGVVVRSRCRWP